MKIYIITDTHFNHPQMVQYCNRPVNFEEKIKSGLLDLPKDCLLIHLGDVCIGMDNEVHEFISSLPYKKILIRGNHDRKADKYYLDHGWDFVCDQFTGTYFGKKIMFSHTPVAYDGKFDLNIHGHFHNQLPRLLKKEWVVKGEEERNHYDLSVLTGRHKVIAIENTFYRPVNLQNLIHKQNG